jgi:hypothetical protein
VTRICSIKEDDRGVLFRETVGNGRADDSGPDYRNASRSGEVAGWRGGGVAGTIGVVPPATR